MIGNARETAGADIGPGVKLGLAIVAETGVYLAGKDVAHDTLTERNVAPLVEQKEDCLEAQDDPDCSLQAIAELDTKIQDQQDYAETRSDLIALFPPLALAALFVYAEVRKRRR